MILAVDVAYKDSLAFASGILFQNWSDTIPQRQITTRIDHIQDYVPGQFYKRELPCILELLTQLDTLPATIFVDGFVLLGRDRRPGLGQHLYEELKGKVTVIGVAKTLFYDTPRETELYRKDSKRPLYITAAGVDEAEAKSYIVKMHGANRIPTLLKLVDQICKSTLKEILR